MSHVGLVSGMLLDALCCIPLYYCPITRVGMSLFCNEDIWVVAVGFPVQEGLLSDHLGFAFERLGHPLAVQ